MLSECYHVARSLLSRVIWRPTVLLSNLVCPTDHHGTFTMGLAAQTPGPNSDTRAMSNGQCWAANSTQTLDALWQGVVAASVPAQISLTAVS